jgi:predicted Kef-type K+ transport protein/voltage-gated potassium channel Kch
MPPLEAFYVAVALTFSSTIIIVKLLSDKREIDSLHGRVALGFLIVQDIVVVLAMIVLSAFGVGRAAEDPLRAVVLVVGAGGLVSLFVLLFVRFLGDPLTERLARNPELLLLFAVALAAGGAAVADALASTPYRDALSARLSPLRDFLLLFFFVALGSRLDLAQMHADLVPAITFSLFVLVGNPLILLAIMGAMGFRKRTGFLAGLTVAQISEFSLVFVAMGVSLGHASEAALGLTTLVGLVTIAASTYMIIWSHELYAFLEPLLQPFERRVTPREPAADLPPGDQTPQILVVGLGTLGSALATRLVQGGHRVLAVDFDPTVVRAARREGTAVVYGDASDPELLAHLPLSRTDWVVITVPGVEQTRGGPHTRAPNWVVITVPGVEQRLTHEDPRRAVLQGLRAIGFTGRIAAVARNEDEARELARLGADRILSPFEDAADRRGAAPQRVGDGPDRAGALSSRAPWGSRGVAGRRSAFEGSRVAGMRRRMVFADAAPARLAHRTRSGERAWARCTTTGRSRRRTGLGPRARRAWPSGRGGCSLRASPTTGDSSSPTAFTSIGRAARTSGTSTATATSTGSAGTARCCSATAIRW